jgi:hypothetical protein
MICTADCRYTETSLAKLGSTPRSVECDRAPAGGVEGTMMAVIVTLDKVVTTSSREHPNGFNPIRRPVLISSCST